MSNCKVKTEESRNYFKSSDCVGTQVVVQKAFYKGSVTIAVRDRIASKNIWANTSISPEEAVEMAEALLKAAREAK